MDWRMANIISYHFNWSYWSLPCKKEGIKIWLQAQEELRYGRLPGQAILDGISVFTGGILLLTPGFLLTPLVF